MPVTSCNKQPQYALVILLELTSLNFVEGRAWPSSLEKKIFKKEQNQPTKIILTLNLNTLQGQLEVIKIKSFVHQRTLSKKWDDNL